MRRTIIRSLGARDHRAADGHRAGRAARHRERADRLDRRPHQRDGDVRQPASTAPTAPLARRSPALRHAPARRSGRTQGPVVRATRRGPRPQRRHARPDRPHLPRPPGHRRRPGRPPGADGRWLGRQPDADQRRSRSPPRRSWPRRKAARQGAGQVSGATRVIAGLRKAGPAAPGRRDPRPAARASPGQVTTGRQARRRHPEPAVDVRRRAHRQGPASRGARRERRRHRPDALQRHRPAPGHAVRLDVPAQGRRPAATPTRPT